MGSSPVKAEVHVFNFIEPMAHQQKEANLMTNCFSQGLYFLPGLGLPRPKAIVVIPKNQPLPKYLR